MAASSSSSAGVECLNLAVFVGAASQPRSLGDKPVLNRGWKAASSIERIFILQKKAPPGRGLVY
jgi:hypothetical protein